MGYEGAGRGGSVLVYVTYMCEIVRSNLIKMKTIKKIKRRRFDKGPRYMFFWN